MGTHTMLESDDTFRMDIGQILFAKMLAIVIVLWVLWGFVIVGVWVKGLRREHITKKNRKKKQRVTLDENCKKVQNKSMSKRKIQPYRSDRVAKYYAERPGTKYLGWVEAKNLPYRCAFGDFDGGAYCVEMDDD